MIEVQSIHKRFHDQEVLKGVSLNVEAGQVVCLIGPSGSGKSTLLRCINGLETYDAGTITVEGVRVDARSKHIHELRTQVGMVFQRFNLFPHRTALENVCEGPLYVKKEPVRRRARKRGICSTRSASHTGWTRIQRNSRAASNSASPSRVLWRWSRKRFCLTNRLPRSIRNSSAKCSA
jgi:ABC-type polar amino acid transport system, ATPase component